MRVKRKFSWFRLLLTVLVFYFGYVGVQQQIHISNIETEKETANVRLAEAQKLNQELREEKQRLRQAVYVEKVAREELGLVKPGEMPYISSN